MPHCLFFLTFLAISIKWISHKGACRVKKKKLKNIDFSPRLIATNHTNFLMHYFSILYPNVKRDFLLSIGQYVSKESSPRCVPETLSSATRRLDGPPPTAIRPMPACLRRRPIALCYWRLSWTGYILLIQLLRLLVGFAMTIRVVILCVHACKQSWFYNIAFERLRDFILSRLIN